MNVDKIRRDFKILETGITYLDSSCVALKPRQVVDEINRYYNDFPACGGRSMHKLGNAVTDAVRDSRRIIRKFINAKHDEEIIFTRNTTEGINLVANSLKFSKVITSDKEHNSNLIPWLKSKAQHQVFRFGDLEDFEAKVKGAQLASIGHQSNLDGTSNPVKEMIKIAHDNNCLVMLDAAQSAPHRELNVKKLDADFLAMSGHKMLGPSGTGALYGKKELLEKLDQYIVGGETVKESYYDRYDVEDVPERFEAGLQNYAGIMGMAAAAKYLDKIGLSNVHKHEISLNKIMTERLGEKVKLLGPKDPEERAGVFSFNIEGLDPHEIALILDQSDIAIRSGAHCVHSWFNANKLKGSARASAYIYNNESDVEKFCDEVEKIISLR